MDTTSWLWPDRVIGKRESHKLRDEHNQLVDSHAELLTELKAALPFIGYLPRDPQAIVDRIKAAIAKAEGRS